MTMPRSSFNAHVTGVAGNIVSIESDGPIMKNEVAYINVGEDRLKSEVLRVYGKVADMQVFEETQGVRIGDSVELTKHMLSAVLGPGLLGTIYDGLQNPLHQLAERDGFFLHRGSTVPALPVDTQWTFEPSCSEGDRLFAGDVIGTVPERRITHKIMVPFAEREEFELLWIGKGNYRIDETIARVRDRRGRERDLTMQQSWPVRRALPAGLLRQRLCERQFPTERLTTTTRLIDTFFPIARGGTACIPGPFGAGKTVLQGLIARYSDVDIVIVVACGERAGEVLETVTEFSTMEDPRSGGKLIDRTIIICNTSSMPVAAREASIYMGITLGEYYRQMGLNVLLIADSTSRWAQAMRETSGRLEEIPGEEAFPAYLDSSVKSVYERAGLLRTNDGSEGSLTMIGTVSPAGGNFEEPVTQSTLGAVKCFLGLSSERAYKRFYPAVDPLLSWSRYLDQLGPQLDRELDPRWTDSVKQMTELLHRGDSVYQMMQVTGEEGVTLDDFLDYQRATFLDMVFLQQDAFDPVDVSVSTERQKGSFQLLRRLINRSYEFTDKEQIREYFTRLTGLFKNLNYAEWNSQPYKQLWDQIHELEQTAISGQAKPAEDPAVST
ncbi:V-type sodium ATPase catalytic subunit A [Symmachiella macrocystis]|uniref:V-type ATP synthase alpha chain n=2 Tax=Symmachiella macrocystis TaxID=2527985 RepID=A0A5C6BAR2_9PLAN|nr:V-type sodium ATPase catalytic subunit A [Symmachiella macrocystis]